MADPGLCQSARGNQWCELTSVPYAVSGQALALAMTFYNETALAVVGLPEDRAHLQNICHQKILELLQTYVDVAVPTRGQAQTNAPNPKTTKKADRTFFQNIASLAIDYCKKLDANELLFGGLYVILLAVAPCLNETCAVRREHGDRKALLL